MSAIDLSKCVTTKDFVHFIKLYEKDPVALDAIFQKAIAMLNLFKRLRPNNENRIEAIRDWQHIYSLSRYASTNASKNSPRLLPRNLFGTYKW